MNYKKCPRCELNFIPESEQLCDVCKQETGTDEPPIYFPITKLICGHTYGTNSKTIYYELCKGLNFDKTKIGYFGFQKPLYAENCDTSRKNDIWFIAYPNYNISRVTNTDPGEKKINFILNDGDNIIVVVPKYIGYANEANVITFVKTLNGYKFLGVYELIKNGTTRHYRRISKVYPY